ncbi:hypothetical protein NHJ6243_001956 [Beauveria neobassiana]
MDFNNDPGTPSRARREYHAMRRTISRVLSVQAGCGQDGVIGHPRQPASSKGWVKDMSDNDLVYVQLSNTYTFVNESNSELI